MHVVDITYIDGFVFIRCSQICLFCRQRGHSLKNCQKKNENDMEAKLCYNCGETGHSLSRCPLPLQDGNLLLYSFKLQSSWFKPWAMFAENIKGLGFSVLV